MKPASWPRYMREKSLAGGRTAYYWSPQIRDLRNGCPVEPEALGEDYAAAVERANFLNQHLDAWRGGREITKDLDLTARFGTIDWWIERYKRTDAFKTLSARSREDYEEALRRLSDLQTELIDAKTGSPVRVGTLPVGSLSASTSSTRCCGSAVSHARPTIPSMSPGERGRLWRASTQGSS